MRNEAYTMENIFKLNVRSFITVIKNETHVSGSRNNAALANTLDFQVNFMLSSFQSKRLVEG